MEVKHLSYGLNVVLIILLIVGATFAINKVTEVTEDYEAMASYMENEKTELIKTNEVMVQEIKTINQNIVSSDEKIKELSEELGKYKSISSYTKAELLSELKGITIEYSAPDGTLTESMYVPDTNCVPIDTLDKYYMQYPKKVEFNDKWVSFNATVNKKSLTLDNLSMINKFDVTIGKRTVGKKFLIFNKKEYVVDLKSYNPYTTVPHLNNITVEPDRVKPVTKILTYTGFFFLGAAVNQLRK